MRNEQHVALERGGVAAHELQLAARFEIAGQEHAAIRRLDPHDAWQVVGFEARHRVVRGRRLQHAEAHAIPIPLLSRFAAPDVTTVLDAALDDRVVRGQQRR